MTNDWQDIRHQAQNDILAYMSLMKPDTSLGPQHYLFRDIIQEITSRKSRFICISCPPRHSKSYTFSQALPAWYLGNNPKHQVIATSYSSSLAQNFGSSVRAEMTTDLYGQIFSKDSQPSGSSTSGSDFQTNVGGKYKAAGVTASLTGFGGNLIIADDLVKNAETADSPVYKAMLEKFFGETLYTRLMPNGVIIVMGTRWREDDLVGYILKNFPDWLHINVPAITEEQDLGTPGALGRGLGEALWPDFFTAEDLNRTRKVLHEGPFQALYQGRPVSAKGGTLSAANVHWAEHSHELTGRVVHRVVSWDTALTVKQKSDYTVGQSWLLTDTGKMWMESYVRFRGTMPEVQAKIAEWHVDSDLPTTTLIEHSHMGIGLKDGLALSHPSMPVVLFQPGHYGSKLDRLQHTLIDWQKGDVLLRRGIDEDCLDELLKAGFTPHDDFLDAATQAILYARSLNLASMVLPLPLSNTVRNLDRQISNRQLGTFKRRQWAKIW